MFRLDNNPSNCKIILWCLHNNFFSTLFAWWWSFIELKHVALKPYNTLKELRCDLQLLSTYISFPKWDVLHNNKNILYIDVEMKVFLCQPRVVNWMKVTFVKYVHRSNLDGYGSLKINGTVLILHDGFAIYI